MNFETKYIIRYGIPGWVLIIGISAFIISADLNHYKNILNDKWIQALSISTILAGVGVPLGYLLQQIGLSLDWVFFRKWNKYFKDEYELHQIFDTHNNGEKYRTRYRYLLGTVKELSALKYSFVACVTVSMILMSNGHITIGSVTVVSIQILLLIFTFINHWYFQANLNHYIKSLKKQLKNST